jgi:ribonucleoside-diphosphate reductase alpha chain
MPRRADPDSVAVFQWTLCPVAPTRFTHPIAVETWDAWFRWRDGDTLRDRTINDTWQRVAACVARAEGAHAAGWANRFRDAFSQWRLLPGERLLRHAGAVPAPRRPRAPAAVLNVAAFVTTPIGEQARFEYVRFMETAALAVRLLDDALASCDFVAKDDGLRVGMIGLGDALVALGTRYGSEPARHTAQVVARALAEGCLLGSVELAGERGASRLPPREEMLDRWRRRGMSPWLLERAARVGVRHDRICSVTRHPLRDDHRERRAALLAAIEPWIDRPVSPAGIVTTETARTSAA